MDLSLDEIIKNKNVRRGSQNPRGRLLRSSNGRGNNKPLQSNNGRISRLPRRSLQGRERSRGEFANRNSVFADARLKIIQKNRLRLTDAREKLSDLAKQTDARNKIRDRNLNPTQQSDRRRDRGRGGRDGLNRFNTRTAPVLLQRSIRNNIPDRMDPSSLIRCTISRQEENFSAQSYGMYADDEEMPLSVRPHEDLSSIKVVAQNEYTRYGQEYLPNMPEPMYVDHNYDHPVYNRQLDNNRDLNLARASGGRMSQEMRARLDTPVKPSTFSYPLISQSTQPSQGHRIVVSNLHPSVTHEDIKELFEDIGPLMTSRLVRAGTAEVIYKLQKDAKKAVEAYHNRQLDGQPMKCLLVNPRLPTGTAGVLRSSNLPTPKFPSSSKSMVVPDLSAIHKALFANK